MTRAHRLLTTLTCVIVIIPFFSGCRHGRHRRVVIVNPRGKVAGDFQSIADYLDDPVVRDILDFMPHFTGSSPPDVEGEYDADGTIETTTIPGTDPGDQVIADFCFGAAAGSRIDVVIQDTTVVNAGALSFIEGSGDRFTVYTAFKSVQHQDDGSTCEIHEVNVFSGNRHADGSFSELFIGQGIVGLIGDCGNLLVGDFQVSRNTANRVAGSCAVDPGAGPVDPANVLVHVENNLVVDLLIFLDDDSNPTVSVAPSTVGSFEARPGFALFFQSIQPSAGQDDQGSELLMGEVVSGQFGNDATPAGGTITYAIENQVGSDIFFAPLPMNQTAFDIYSVVNVGVAVPGYPDPPGSGLDCLCIMAPSPDPYVVGYYSYSVPGVISASQANVVFRRVANNNAVDEFDGPFQLAPGAGTVTLIVR